LVRDNVLGMVPLAYHVLANHGLLAGLAGGGFQQVLASQEVSKGACLNKRLAETYIVRVSNDVWLVILLLHAAGRADERIQDVGRISVLHPAMPRLSSSVSSMPNHFFKAATLSSSLAHVSTT